MRTVLLACLTLTALAFAGCSGDGNASNGPGGQSASGGGSLAYNGASDGSQSYSFESDGSCELILNANLGSGKVTVTMTTPGGTTVTGSFSGPGQTSKSLGDASDSAPGEWSIKAQRSGGFTGQYTATADC